MAAEKWAGFTDEDIERIKTRPTSLREVNGIGRMHGGESSIEGTSAPMRLKTIVQMADEKNILSNVGRDETFDSEPEANRCHPNLKNIGSLKGAFAQNEIEEICTCNSVENGAYYSDDSTDASTDSIRKDAPCDRSFDSSINLQELELFEMRQKRVEAENARRRALINKAILDKKMQTQAESEKLAKITEELKRLDGILSADVSILRDYIEKASMEFTEAEKRYLKAEKEFIDAKLHLYDRMQRKEQLTEHLCAIIEQNENRKANKLVELMRQLQMETIVDENPQGEDDSTPILSKYCMLNEEAYHCCQTLKPNNQVTLPDNSEQPSVTENNSPPPDTSIPSGEKTS